MENRPQIFACVGPESTGKTTLANQLADHFNTHAVPEFAREYLDRKNGLYEKEDLVIIAKSQAELEKMYVEKSNELLFCDTDVLTVLIWHQYKYKKRNKEIEKLLNEQPPRKYLLMYPDLPWDADPLRENPDDLKSIFRFYKYSLKMIAPDHVIIQGSGNDRLQNAIDAVNQFDFG